jgi:hypothetical protein
MTEEEQNELQAQADNITEVYEEYAHDAWHAGNDVGEEQGQLIMAGALAQDLAERIHNVQHNSTWQVIAEDREIADAYALLQGASVILHRQYNQEWRDQYRTLAVMLHDVTKHLVQAIEKDEEE